MNIRKTIILMLFLSAHMASAQADFRPGYIITVPGDTLYGEIDYRGDLLMGSVCRFRNEHKEIKDYTPNDIFAFRFIDSKFFISKDVDGKRMFLEYLLNGEVNVYYVRDDSGDHYYINRDGEDLVEIPYEEGIRRIRGRQILYQSNHHVGLLTYYMQDAPQLKSKIDRIKSPSHHNLIKIAEEYHHAVCDDKECIIYEKRQPLIKVNLEGVIGAIYLNNKAILENDLMDVLDRPYFLRGVLVHFWLPRANEKLFLKTGILYTKLRENDGGRTSYLKVPLHIGYMAPPTYTIRPTFSFSIYSPSYSAGVVAKVSEHVNIGVQAWGDFYSTKIPWVPAQLMQYSILGNVYFEF